jgi:hypothetical protein
MAKQNDHFVLKLGFGLDWGLILDTFTNFEGDEYLGVYPKESYNQGE